MRQTDSQKKKKRRSLECLPLAYLMRRWSLSQTPHFTQVKAQLHTYAHTETSNVFHTHARTPKNTYTRKESERVFSPPPPIFFANMKLFALVFALAAFVAPAAAQYQFGRATFYGVDGCKSSWRHWIHWRAGPIEIDLRPLSQGRVAVAQKKR